MISMYATSKVRREILCNGRLALNKALPVLTLRTSQESHRTVGPGADVVSCAFRADITILALDHDCQCPEKIIHACSTNTLLNCRRIFLAVGTLICSACDGCLQHCFQLPNLLRSCIPFLSQNQHCSKTNASRLASCSSTFQKNMLNTLLSLLWCANSNCVENKEASDTVSFIVNCKSIVAQSRPLLYFSSFAEIRNAIVI
jgi:hypothetical protein